MHMSSVYMPLLHHSSVLVHVQRWFAGLGGRPRLTVAVIVIGTDSSCTRIDHTHNRGVGYGDERRTAQGYNVFTWVVET